MARHRLHFQRLNLVDGWPVFELGWSDLLTRWQPDRDPEVATMLHVMATNRCWVDLSAVVPSGGRLDNLRDRTRKRLERVLTSIAAIEPALGEALAFETRSHAGRVFGRIRPPAGEELITS